MITCSIEHRDTCLPGYAQRSYHVAVSVDGTTTLGQVIDAIDDEWCSDGFVDGEDVTAEQAFAFDKAIEALKQKHVTKLAAPFNEALPLQSDDFGGESVYAYFDVLFSDDA